MRLGEDRGEGTRIRPAETHARLELDEQTEVGKITHDTVMNRINRIFHEKILPWVWVKLLHTESELFVVFVDTKHHCFYDLSH